MPCGVAKKKITNPLKHKWAIEIFIDGVEVGMFDIPSPIFNFVNELRP